MVADVASERGDSVRAIGEEEMTPRLTAPMLAQSMRLNIDFTTPQAVIPTYDARSRPGARAVVGTTDWYES